jgi:hypothetical protein
MTSNGVTLDEAREWVGEAMSVDRRNWWWTPEEVRWLAGQWRLTLPSDDDIEVFEPVRVALLRGAAWWVLDSPRTLRVMTAVAVLFCYGFGWGWFNA